MKRQKYLIVSAICMLAYFGLAETSWAIYIDDKKTLSFGAKLQTRATFRLQDASGFTQPDVQTGDLVQWRNLALLEVDHDLKQLTKSLDSCAFATWVA